MFVIFNLIFYANTVSLLHALKYWFARIHRTDLSACAAIGTKLWVNYIGDALAYCALRTLRKTNPAAYAVFYNVIGHNKYRSKVKGLR